MILYVKINPYTIKILKEHHDVNLDNGFLFVLGYHSDGNLCKMFWKNTRILEECREERLDTRYYSDECRKIFRERKDKLDGRGWTNLDVEYITEIKLKVLQTINNNNTNMTALKFAVMDLLDEELENL